MKIEKHFVTFYSPGTFVAETTEKEIDNWDIEQATAMAENITERYGARPYAFQFSTRSRSETDLDSHVSSTSGMYYLPHCKVETIDDVRQRADPNERILLSNMECNNWPKIVSATEGWKWTQPLEDGDVVLAK